MDQFPKDTLTELQKHLETEKIRLLARIKELTVQDPFSDPDRTNDNAASDTEASEESNHDRVAALTDELKVQVANVEKALGRITDGTYGFCSVCGNMIDTDRLSVMPTATLCLTHEKELTAKQKATA
jgi:RNA polymerase-binding transcription factor DksA